MKFYFVKTPNWIQNLFKNWVWSFNTSKKEIYLTFDDGPTPEITNWTLSLLSKYKAKATFFCIGKNVKNNPAIFANIRDQGHSIGNHTNNHLNGWSVSHASYILNILEAEETFKSQIQNSSKPATNNQQLSTTLFRPPYGKIKTNQAKKLRKLGYKIIMWDVLSADFDQSITEETCLDNVRKNTQAGSIIIFHDSLKAEKNLKYTLPKVLEYYSNKGYEFKALKF